MHILITGAGGMLGRKLAARLSEDPRVDGLTLADLTPPDPPSSFEAKTQSYGLDLSDPQSADSLLEGQPSAIVHLAAIVSGEAEADFEKGYRVNVDGTRALLEAVRARHAATVGGESYRPRFVFSSSLAVFGPPLPDLIGDDQRLTPRSSYGAQKAIGELLVADYHRKGFVDGVSLRLPTISVRPGAPNKAASSFYSSIIREPLNGEMAYVPVPREMRHWFQSPRAAVKNLAHAVFANLDDVGFERTINLPGCSASVSEMLEALEQVAGPKALAFVEDRLEPAIMDIVLGWPRAFDADQALKLGFVGENVFDEIVHTYVEDDMP
ncbi:MAG: D-erythronate dehydrogenase [Pseudomonadota bacterium]